LGEGEVQKIPAAAKQRTIILLQLALLLLNTPTMNANLHINHNCCPNLLLNRLTKSVNPNLLSCAAACPGAAPGPAPCAAGRGFSRTKVRTSTCQPCWAREDTPWGDTRRAGRPSWVVTGMTVSEERRIFGVRFICTRIGLPLRLVLDHKCVD